jgi:hypothetical protein
LDNQKRSKFVMNVIVSPIPHHLITLTEAAERIGRKKKTIQNWISEGKVRGAQGLWYSAGRPMLDWDVFSVWTFKKAD